MTEDAVKQRVKSYLKETKCTINSISNGVNSIQVKLNRQINGSVSVSLDSILYILDCFQGLSAEWLLRGEGSMNKVENGYIMETIETVCDDMSSQSVKAVEKLYEDLLDVRDKRIRELEMELAKLKKGIAI